MTITPTPTFEVTAPALVSYPFGLFSVASATTPADAHWQAGAWWRSVGCGLVGVTFGVCQVDDAYPNLPPFFPTREEGDEAAPPFKDVNVDCSIGTGLAFTVFARSDESMGGAPLDSKFAAARSALLAGEQHAVERALWAMLMTAVPAATVSPGTVAEAVALLEALVPWSGYGGTPVFHMDRYTASRASSDYAIHAEGSRLLTGLGSSVVAGGGYSEPPTDAAPDIIMFGTGALNVIRGDVFDLGQSYDTLTNSISAVVERTYVVGWDCTAVRADVSPGPV